VKTRLLGSGHSGRTGVDLEAWPVLPFVRRCPGASRPARCPPAVLQVVPGSATASGYRRGARPVAHGGRQALASPMSTDALATSHCQGGQPRPADAAVLEVRRTFVPNRLSAAYLAAAYAHVVPDHRRRTGATDALTAPLAEPPRWRAAGEG
jgi:hypothetical protein